jgi:hypothetical protein
VRHQWLFRCAILLVAWLVPGCSGQRYIRVQVERDGALVLKTEYGVSDSLSAAAIWRGLQEDSFGAVGTIEPEKDDPRKAVLKGKIRIVIHHVDNEIAAANVDDLRLIRDSESSKQWKLAPGEMIRTGKAAGL